MNVLVIGKGKSGTTVISKTIQHSLPGSCFHMEPKEVGYFERIQPHPQGDVIKILFDPWMRRLRLLNGIVHGETGCRFDKIVAIIRDPRDVLISETLYRPFNVLRRVSGRDAFTPMIELLREKEADPRAVSFAEIIDCSDRICPKIEIVRGAGGQYLHWLSQLIRGKSKDVPLHVLRYEDFIADRTADLSDFLGVPLSDERDVGKFQRTRRSAASDNWRRWFTSADIARFKPLLQPMIEQWGFTTEWDLDPSPSIAAAEGSTYVERLLDEAETVAVRKSRKNVGDNPRETPEQAETLKQRRARSQRQET